MADKIKVLMVDDEEQFRKTTSKILNRKGYETTMAGSGEEAIDILEKQPHDVVVLDIKMPGMDGHKALNEIKKIRSDTQVIMLTGHGGIDSAKASLELGAYDYLSKPCDIDLLAAKINNAYASVVHKGEVNAEKTARDIMIHIDDYTTIGEDKTVRQAIEHLMRSFEGLISSSRVMETGHRSILVFDRDENLKGFLSIKDLIGAVRPAYLSAPKPSMADSIQYSAMFWSGLFITQSKSLGNKKVGDIMSEEEPPTVDENTNLMDLADTMYSQGIRRLVVTSGDNIIGVVREQELFFEMANIIL
ncbi:response regulator [Desulfonema magnum]|uniref:Two component system response regulator, CBS domain-containing n=1 Tax=Desulfonema magnum TaxID=45655 RepID=A0A975BQ36_9BACT|nr:response regulator [Desulfonema magnum]QTA89558.1 Two component system response regulator, CBS domain-containing [Desulfonema magnum]